MQFWPSEHSTLLHPHLVSAKPKRELKLHPHLPAMRLNRQNEAQLVSSSLTLTSHEEDPLGTEAITLGGIIKAEQGGAWEVVITLLHSSPGTRGPSGKVSFPYPGINEVK